MRVASKVHNPYLDEFIGIYGDDIYEPNKCLLRNDGYVHRFPMVRKYSWAVPDEQALDTIAEYSPIVEIGAGAGYWAYLLRQMGVDVIAYDRIPPDGSEWPEGDERNDTVVGVNWYHRGHSAWTEVLRGGPKCVRQHADRTLMICWPPMNGMAYRCLTMYEGDTVIYIGEGDGGCNADKRFFKELGKKWEEAETVDIPQWDGLYDRMQVYKRKL